MTILEIHFHDVEFTFAPSVGSATDGARESDETDESVEPAASTDEVSTEEPPGRAALGVIAALAVFVALGALARRRLGGSE